MEAGGLDLSNVKNLVFIKGVSGAADGTVSLKAGDVVQAKVVTASENSVILNIGGSRITASSNLPFSPGQGISLMVIELTPEKVVFKQLTDQNAAPTAPKYAKDDLIDYLFKNTGLNTEGLQNVAESLKDMRIDIGRDLAMLKSLIVSIGDNDVLQGVDLDRLLGAIDEIAAAPANRQEVVAGLRSLLESINHEADLVRYLEHGTGDINNLKTILLQSQEVLQSHLQSTTGAMLSTVKSSIGKVLDALNSTKILNLPIDSQAKDFIYLPLPIRLGDELRTADIRIYRDGSGGKSQADQKSFTVAFALDMPEIGKTRAWIEVVEKFINFSITTENKEAMQESKKMFDELERSFNELGYTVGRLSAIDARQENPKSLIEEKIGLKLEGIDFRA